MKNTEKMQALFLESYTEHADALFRYCFFKVSDRELAKDLVQEMFTKTWEYLAKGGEIDNMKSFLYRTLGNLVIDHYRKKKTQSLDELYEKGFDYGEDTTDSLYARLDGERAMILLKKLPESCREIIYMKYVQELSLKEIAEITGKSQNNIAVRLHRGLKSAKKLLDKEGHE